VRWLSASSVFRYRNIVISLIEGFGGPVWMKDLCQISLWRSFGLDG